MNTSSGKANLAMLTDTYSQAIHLLHRGCHNNPLRATSRVLPSPYTITLEVPHPRRERFRSPPHEHRFTRRSVVFVCRHREVLVALGKDRYPQLEHSSLESQLLRYHHADLQFLPVPAYDYQCIGVQECEG